jgi:hypothetical protein
VSKYKHVGNIVTPVYRKQREPSGFVILGVILLIIFVASCS